ncbi:MAG TPA: acyltransferase [Acidisarcina sp.]
MSQVEVAPTARVQGTTFLFVDNVRFWSMAVVVALHSVYFAWTGVAMMVPVFRMMTVLKFGTIGFFVIAGFLLGSHMRTEKPAPYLMRRVKRLVVPWLLWFALMVVTARCLFHTHIYHRQVAFSFSFGECQLLASQAYLTLIASSFWFVPNLLLGICVLLLFRRVLYRKELGAALLALNLFYSANIYGRWFTLRSTEALFGYMFFLWVGSYASHHHAELHAWLTRTPWKALIGVALLGIAASLAEETWLIHLAATDPVHILRVSNQLLSITLLLLMAKAKRPTSPSFINVRRDTFGIYLAHWMVAVGCWHVGVFVMRRAGTSYLQIGFGARLIFAVLLFVFTYGFSLWITQVLASSKSMAWMVGAGSEAGRPRPRRLTRRLDTAIASWRS